MASTDRNIGWVIQEVSEDQKKDFVTQVNKIMDDTEKEQAIAEHIKAYFDKNHAPNWHCVVGKHFASFVTYQSKNYIFC
jgi:dynein light chain LC8-type